MNKTLNLLIIGLTIITILPIAIVYGENIETTSHQIVISTEENAISVQESLTIQGESNETYQIIKFWIQTDAENVLILANNNEISPIDNDYTYNLSFLNISMESALQITISYTLSKDVEQFSKTILRNTTSLSVEFNGNTIYTGQNLQSGASCTVLLYKPTEAPLSGYIILFILLLIVVLVVTLLYAFRKQKPRTIETGVESEELLNTKKALLMSLLKDLEKQHRSKHISDDTYNKIKEQYKQQAVETMKKIEDMKS